MKKRAGQDRKSQYCGIQYLMTQYTRRLTLENVTELVRNKNRDGHRFT